MSSKESRFADRILGALIGDFDGGLDGLSGQKRAPNRHELVKIEQLAYAKDQGLKAPLSRSLPKRAQSAPGCRRPAAEGMPSLAMRANAGGESLSFNRPQTAHSTNSLRPLSSAGSRSAMISGRDSSRRRPGASRQNGFGIAPRKLLRQVLYSNSDTHRESFPLAPGQYDISLGGIHWRRDLESNQSQQYLSKHKTVPVYSFGKPQIGKSKEKDGNPDSMFQMPGPGYYTLPDPWARYDAKGMSFTATHTSNFVDESRFGNFVKKAKDMEIL
eukprot:gnl/MRDRNA2_/MRDRNA2_112403_c0_seq1.p1 gnl/MRDRNA2_/MRDRNA2_112403_c0~~gnl/MRDRNA2_/MRDRNA2_112403_c0_seq1.p1  ORF type:complete len:272 (+),score=53.74 gnl/MRDRNA2_/MRDRNA2_112403_c0_seq1:43-858(+)